MTVRISLFWTQTNIFVLILHPPVQSDGIFWKFYDYQTHERSWSRAVWWSRETKNNVISNAKSAREKPYSSLGVQWRLTRAPSQIGTVRSNPKTFSRSWTVRFKSNLSSLGLNSYYLWNEHCGVLVILCFRFEKNDTCFSDSGLAQAGMIAEIMIENTIFLRFLKFLSQKMNCFQKLNCRHSPPAPPHTRTHDAHMHTHTQKGRNKTTTKIVPPSRGYVDDTGGHHSNQSIANSFWCPSFPPRRGAITSPPPPTHAQTWCLAPCPLEDSYKWKIREFINARSGHKLSSEGHTCPWSKVAHNA